MIVNSFGSVVVNDTPHFWAAPFEYENEFGGFGNSNKFEPLKKLRERHQMILRKIQSSELLPLMPNCLKLNAKHSLLLHMTVLQEQFSHHIQPLTVI